MTITLINTTNTAAQTVAGGDDLLVGKDGCLLVAGDEAITVTGTYATVTVQGTVISGAASTIVTQQTDPDVGLWTDLVIAEGGYVGGNYAIVLRGGVIAVTNYGTVTADNWGVSVSGSSASLSNHGAIYSNALNGSYAAVTLSGSFASVLNTGSIVSDGHLGVELSGTQVRLTNSGLIRGGAYIWSDSAELVNHGTIQGWGTGINISSAPQGVVSLFNDGTISADTAVSFGGGAARTMTMVNAGILNGDVTLGAGDDRYDGREGKLFGELLLNGGNDVALGGAAAETMLGGGGLDSLEGNGGADNLIGKAGEDTIDGGAGNDVLGGGAGDDEIAGGDGSDTVVGGEGGDLLDGGAGIDELWYVGSSAAVYVNLATGEAWGGDAQGDEFSGFERLWGSSHNDTLLGSGGGDTINGFLGDDLLRGGAGNDLLRGREGDDTLEGGAGREIMAGGDGADVFRFRALTESTSTGSGRDVIRDFAPGEDVIEVALIDPSGTAGDQAFAWRGSLGFLANGTAQLRFQEWNGNTLVQLDANGDQAVEMSILLTGVHALTQADFAL